MPTTLPRSKLTVGPSRHVYDAIVFGGQLGGALCAALLAKRSHRVLLVEHDGQGAGYPKDDFLLPFAPFVAPPLKAMPGAEAAFTELGLTTQLQRTVGMQQPDLQLILPRHRIDLSREEPRRLAALQREMGETGAEVSRAIGALAAAHEATDAFFHAGQTLPPQGMMERFKLRGRIKEVPALEAPSPLGGDDPVSHLLRGLLPFVNYVDSASSTAAVRPLSQVVKTPGLLPQGREALRELLLKRLTDLGGDVLPQQQSVVEALSFEGSNLVGLQVLRSENVYRGAALVAATDAGALRRLLPEKKRHRALAELLDVSAIKRFLLSVNWVIPEAVLPRGMGELLLMDAGAELGPMLIQVGPARRVGKDDDEDGFRTVCAGAFVPSSARELGEEHLKGLVAKMEERLEDLMPFAKERAKVRSSPHLDAGNVRGSRLMPHPLYAMETDTYLGVTGLPVQTPVKNLYLASREVLPGLGLEGELLAGIRAAALVQESLGKKNPLKR
jgi:phytoene dehydrogenase-like protein